MDAIETAKIELTNSPGQYLACKFSETIQTIELVPQPRNPQCDSISRRGISAARESKMHY